jgi:hypothetical protein
VVCVDGGGRAGVCVCIGGGVGWGGNRMLIGAAGEGARVGVWVWVGSEDRAVGAEGGGGGSRMECGVYEWGFLCVGCVRLCCILLFLF